MASNTYRRRVAQAMMMIGCISCLGMIAPTFALAVVEVDGVFGLTPAGPGNRVAIEINHAPGASLSRLAWFHNDETVNFPSLVLMEGVQGVPPDLENTALVLDELSGASLDWGDVVLDFPVTSTTGTIFAVFRFPEGIERTADGTGGGPGMGYLFRPSAENPRAYITPDGEQWIRVHHDYEVALDLTWSSSKSTPVTLASLREARAPDGQSDDEGPLVEATATTSTVIDKTPLKVYPNPFNPRTQVRLYMSSAGQAKVEVFDLRGRLVNTLVDERREVGEHIIDWEAKDFRGRTVSSGVYLLRATLGGKVHRQRLSLIR